MGLEEGEGWRQDMSMRLAALDRITDVNRRFAIQKLAYRARDEISMSMR